MGIWADFQAEDPIRGVSAVQITPPERISSPVLLETFALRSS